VLRGGALFRLTQQLFPKARIVALETYDELHRALPSGSGVEAVTGQWV
jgi:hypothetical protein